MQYIFIIIWVAVTNAFVPKLCIHCKHCILDEDFIRFSKCKLFPIVDDRLDYYPVIGEELLPKTDYHFCAVARKSKDMCSAKGEFYEPVIEEKK